MQLYQQLPLENNLQRRELCIANAVDHAIERHIDITLHNSDSQQRNNAEAFIAKVFLNHHGAELNYFLPNLFSISDFSGQTIAAVGFKLLGPNPVFLERYLNQPIEEVLQPHILPGLLRSHIAEVGNLACNQAGASRALIASIAFYLHEQGIKWAVFTGTRMVSSILNRMGIPALSLAKAEAAGLIAALNDLLARLQIAYNREGEFVSDVAHELRTPLAGILIQTENMIDELHDNPAIGKLISTKHAIKRLSHLVNQLLSSSRSSQDLTDKSVHSIDLQLLCERVITEQRDRAEAKELSFTTKIESCVIEGNESNLTSLISNLLDNAIKYTPEQGKIRMTLSAAGNQYFLQIADSGDGIPNELHEKVKQRFYRAETHRAEGSGLGLAIVENVVTQMQWQWQWRMSQSELGGLQHEIRFDIN